jgi:hypothetical protein
MSEFDQIFIVSLADRENRTRIISARKANRKYIERYRIGTSIILLDKDLAKACPTSESVNEVLRLLLQIIVQR